MPLPDPLPPVPTLMSGFFRAGGGRILDRIYAETGPGIKFFNELRRQFPKDPRMTQDEYQPLLNYAYQFAKAGSQAAEYISGLDSNEILPESGYPRNYFLPTKDPSEDRYI